MSCDAECTGRRSMIFDAETSLTCFSTVVTTWHTIGSMLWAMNVWIKFADAGSHDDSRMLDREISQ